MTLIPLPYAFTFCQVVDYSKVLLNRPYCFIQKTPRENALICLSDSVPENVIAQDPGWKAFYIEGKLDFSMLGVLAKITSILADLSIPVCALSTFDTDYFFIKKSEFRTALSALYEAGYEII